MVQPLNASKRSRTSRGKGAEPLIQAQREDRSSLGRRGSLIRATKRVGTPGSMVGRYFRMALIKLLISKRGSTMIVAPWDMGQLRQAVRPKECDPVSYTHLRAHETD